LASAQATLRVITQINNQESLHATNMQNGVNEMATSIRELVLLSDARQVGEASERIKAAVESYDQSEENLAAIFAEDPETGQDERDLLAAVAQAKAVAAPALDKVIALAADDKDEDATKALMTELRPAQTRWLASLAQLVALEERENQDAAAAADAEYHRARGMMLALSSTALALGFLAAWTITRSVTVPIARAVHVARTVASGDLTSVIDASAGDETGTLLKALQEMNHSLSAVVNTVRIGSDSIATGSSQIATGNADLSQRTEEQASNLQQAAASMEQLAANVRDNSDAAQEASSMAASARDAAAHGGELVSRVVITMETINESSRKIGAIIGVIDDIAFQTNILALNAAVEAARAGVQGRGFAVVATEVRGLAQRCAEAAKDIKSLIETSVSKAEAGSRLAGEAGSAMGNIVDQVRKVANLISEISASTIEQASGISQVGNAVTQLDQMTQQNAALVEESAAAAESLSHQARVMVEAVSMFKTDGSRSAHEPQ
jgi:methyl-accepting chemotaxis protein